MNGTLLFALLLYALPFPVLPQGDRQPFFLLDKQVKEQQGGWAGSKEDLSKVFNAERIRLGERFEKELLEYLGTDTDKHYWISLFLEEPTYLHGNRPMPYLALVIKQQAISFLRDKKDKASLGDTLTLSVTAAVLSESLGFHSLADTYKQEAERILARGSDFEAWFPGLDQYDRCLYSIIGKKRDPKTAPCKKEDAASANVPLIVRVGRGVLERRATRIPAAVYPEEAKQKGISGEVIVDVLIDESGKVESARAIEGHPLLHKAALAAAYQARFEVTLLQGQPVKVAGVLTYVFKR